MFTHIFVCVCGMRCLFTRVIVTDEEVTELYQHCTEFYRGYWLFFTVNPTVWTLGCVAPAHTKEMKRCYGLGLGLSSMEGREAKHIAISKYCQNTAYAHRWEQVFHHEFISLIWLPTHGYTCTNVNSSSSTGNSYIPKRVRSKDPNYCDCGLEKESSVQSCRFCCHKFRRKIKKSISICKSLL